MTQEKGTKNFKKRERFYAKHNHTCFYTGVKCSQIGVHKRTIEHLISTKVSTLWGLTHSENLFQSLNKVVALKYINERVGNAPLSVKYGLKAYLQGFDVTAYSQSSKPKFVRKFYIEQTDKFLNSFKLEKRFPWRIGNTTPNALSSLLRVEQHLLLTQEEKALLSRFHKNI